MGLSLTTIKKKLFGDSSNTGMQPAPTSANILKNIASGGTTNKGFAYQTRNDPIIQVVTPVAELGRDLVKSTYKTAVGTPVEAGRAAIAAVTNNTKARQAAVSRLKGNIGTGLDMARALPISLYQLGESVNPVGGDVYQREHTFSDPVAKFVFGDKPIPSIQKQYKQNVKERGKVYAGSALGLTALMDAVALKGAAKGAQNLTKGSFETPQPSAPVETRPTIVVKTPQEPVKTPIKAKGATKQVIAKMDVPTDSLAALKQEALKYKSADEFINSGDTLTHYTSTENAKSIRESGFIPKKSKSVQGDGSYFLNKKEYGKYLSDDMKQGNEIITSKLSPDAKILDLKAPGYSGPSPISGNKLKKYALDNGYDGVTDGVQTAVYNTNKILTDKQLTDLYNQAHAEANALKPKVSEKGSQSNKTTQQIHVLKQKQNLADEEYRSLLKKVTGKDSTKKMTIQEKNAVVKEMGGTVKGEKLRGKPAPIVEDPNWAQQLITGTRDLIGKFYGEGGKQIADKIHRVRETRDVLSQHFYNQIPKAMALNKDDFRTMVQGLDDLSNGKNVNVPAHIADAIEEWQRNIEKIQRAASSVGLPTASRGMNYFPHIYKDVLTARGRKSFAQRMVDAGEAEDLADALKRINFIKEKYNRPFGNLEKERTSNLPGYEMTQEALHDYVSKAFDRIARASEFGAKDETLNQLIARLIDDGYDVGPNSTFSKSLNTALGNNDYTTISHKLSRGARTVNAYRSLSLSALTNSGQWVNTATFAGIKRTILAMAKDKEAREFVKNSAVLIDHTIDDIAKGMLGTNGKVAENIASPFFQSIEKFNRATAALSGRDMARDMATRAAKGDKNAELVLRKKLGVTGEIKAKLTYEQEIQAARATVEKTQFKVDPQDLPVIADSAIGKLAFQFKTFGYKQTAFMYNEVMKEAANGNLAPLARFIVTGIPTGIAVATVKGAIRGKLPYQASDFEDPKKAAKAAFKSLQSVGAFGLPGQEINNAINNFEYNKAGSAGIATAAGLLAGPTGSGLVELASNIDKSQNGNSQPLKKQGVRSIPLVGSALASRLYPSKVTEATQKYFNALDAAGNSLKGNENKKAKAKFEEIITRSKDKETGKTIQSSPAESINDARSLLTDDKLRSTYVKFQKNSGDHAPSWNLPDDELKLYLKYKAQYTGDAAKTSVRDEFASKYGADTLKKIQDADSAFYSSLPSTGKGSMANSQTPTYPTFDDATTTLMDAYYNSDSTAKKVLMAQYSDTITDYMNQMATWTKKMRAAEGAPALDDYQSASPEVEKIISIYSVLPSGTGERSAWITAHPNEWAKMQAYYTTSGMYTLTKNAALAQYANEEPSQDLLKSIYNVGNYDIVKTKNSDGTYTYSIGSGSSNGSSGYSSSKNYLKYLGDSEKLRISNPKKTVKAAKINLTSGVSSAKKYSVKKKVTLQKSKVALKQKKV